MPSRTPSTAARYGYGIICVVTALVAAFALRSFDLEGFLFVIAVAVAVWIGGRGPGVVAVVLSVLVLHYGFIAPEHTGALLPTYAYFVVFSVLVVVITVVSEGRHRAERALVHARDDLEIRVKERTAELWRSNERLRGEIAERERAEEEIGRQAALLRLAHDAVIVRDPDSRVTFWNRGAEELYGIAAADALGQVTHEMLRTTFPISRAAVEAEITHRGSWEGELVHLRRDGTVIVVASRWSLQRDAQGAPHAILEINRDVTDRKRAEEALRSAKAELAHVTRVATLGEVTATFAHEVNQPLAAIVNNANACLGLVPDAPALDEVREALTDIVSDAERASAIVRRVRALATRSPSEQVVLALADVVQDVVALAAADADARHVDIRTALPADLPPVLGDRVQLQQVLLNFVVNGIDAMSGVAEHDRVLEIGGRTDVLNGGHAATISVRDRGAGLDGADRARLFEPFYTTKPHGMGMGLAISRSIIEAHGGRLSAEPNDGPGATFSFTVPAADDAAAER